MEAAVRPSFDPIWEEKYRQGHSQRYPWDQVVSFMFRQAPKDRPRGEVRVLEVGCGTGGNLWFAAREGFQVFGVDASPSAIAAARRRFVAEGLAGHFQVADFTSLPYRAEYFDLAVDRGAITCCGRRAAKEAVREVHRVLKVGGKFLFNPVSIFHSSYASGRPGGDGLTLDITAGTLVGVGQIFFYGRRDIEALFEQGWGIISLQHVEVREEVKAQKMVHAEWRVVAVKINGE